MSQPDRRALDEVLFDVLGLTAREREAVYEAVVQLVRARLEKAQSVRTTYEEKSMKHPNVTEAFSILIAELEMALKNTRQAAASATQEGNYDEAQTLLDEARKIERFIAEIRIKQREWTDLGSKSRSKRAAAGPRLPRGQRTPEEAFRLPILRALFALGGQAPMSKVLERVYAEMKPHLKPADLRSLPSDAKTPRWRNTSQWARWALINEGLLQNDSLRGVWAISEKGRKYLGENGS